MASISRGVQYLLHNKVQFCDSIVKNYFSWLPDKLYLSLLYRLRMGSWIDWDNPKTFSEKIQCLKIRNREPEYTTMVDKYAVKKYVAELIGKQHIIPTLGVWDKVDDIDWEVLPNQFVLKTTHGGGSCGVFICKNKSELDRQEVKRKMKRSLASDIYSEFREWPYKNIKKRIIAEKYMVPSDRLNDSTYDLSDYKFFCFNGEPQFCQVIRDRNSNETIDFYDMEWIHQEFIGLNPVARNGLNPVARPNHLDEMQNICRKLSKGIPFVRVDLYVIDDKTYFGELTFFPASGFGVFSPKEWNVKLGDLLELP